jgi:hypothetical protein
MHTFTPPAEVVKVLARHGWPVYPTLDDVELAGQVFGGPVADWSERLVGMSNRTLPGTTGVAYLDDEFHLVGIGLTAGGTAGAQTDHTVTDLSREDACFTLRALDQGFTRVRPMPLAPVAMFDTLAGVGLDGSRLPLGMNPLIAAATAADVPDGARVFVEVDPGHREVVYDIWAVAPSTSAGGLGVWRRHGGQWVDDPGFLATLRGESPPTLIYLPVDSPILSDVLAQVDESTAGQKFEALAASITLSPEIHTDLLPLIARGTRGGLSKAAGVGKGGNAEQLRQYWSHGEGAAKIRWGVGGDWYRCVKHLRKYMGTRAKGYCNLRHKDALGFYPATHAKMEKGHG